MEHHSETAVLVNEAYKTYGKDTHALRGFSMTVDKGRIYGLIGPSGCGKSTILNCIIGQQTLDSGTIKVTCENQINLGYMPQALSLYMLLTIKETLNYYGQICGLNKCEIKERSKEIVDLLDLSSFTQVVEELSGGQQKRVSLAVVLLTNPKIFLLDEPTVGLDPLLAKGIWEHLIKLSKEENKTIIITTHYLEEVKNVDKVGLMRDGILLCEESPTNVMNGNNCESMEEVFLKLCSSEGTQNDEQLKDKPKLPSLDKKENNGSFFSFNCLKAEVNKNVIFIWRNIPMLLLLFILPLIISLSLNYTLGTSPTGLPVAIINEELSGGIGSCIENTHTSCDTDNHLSCRMIRKLAETVKLIEFPTVDDSRNYLVKSRLWGIIRVPQNFTRCLLERLELNLRTTDESLEGGQISVWLDTADNVVVTYLRLYILEGLRGALQNFYHDCGWSQRSFENAIKFEKPIYGTNTYDMRHYGSPPLVILMMFYFSLSYTIGVIMQEKINGVLERSMILGLKLMEVILGHAVIQVAVMLIQMIIVLTIIFIFYDHPFKGNLFLLIALLLLQGLCGLALGFLISLLSDSSFMATSLSVGVLVSYVQLSGCVWPVQGINILLRWITIVIPISYSAEASRAILSRGLGFSHPAVYLGFISVIFWTIAYVVLAYLVKKFKIKVILFTKL